MAGLKCTFCSVAPQPPDPDRQPRSQHLVPQLSGARRIERVAEQRLDLIGSGVELIYQILDAVTVARQGRFQIIQLTRQH